MVAKPSLLSGRPLSSTMAASMPTASACAAACQALNGSADGAVCGTSKASVTSRTAARSGSSASAACESKVSVSTGGAPSSVGRVDQPARHDAGHEAVAARVLLDVADAPRRAARMQVHRELRVVLAGEGVELAGPRHDVEHVGEIGCAPIASANAWIRCTNSEYSISLSGAGAAGQLHAGLQLAVALAARRRLPLAGLGVEPFDEHELAAGMALRRQVRSTHRR